MGLAGCQRADRQWEAPLVELESAAVRNHPIECLVNGEVVERSRGPQTAIGCCLGMEPAIHRQSTRCRPNDESSASCMMGLPSTDAVILATFPALRRQLERGIRVPHDRLDNFGPVASVRALMDEPGRPTTADVPKVLGLLLKGTEAQRWRAYALTIVDSDIGRNVEGAPSCRSTPRPRVSRVAWHGGSDADGPRPER